MEGGQLFFTPPAGGATFFTPPTGGTLRKFGLRKQRSPPPRRKLWDFPYKQVAYKKIV